VRKASLALAGCLGTIALLAPSGKRGRNRFGGCSANRERRASRQAWGATSQPFSYGFTGNLSGCQSSASGAPTAGTVSAGQVINEQVI